MSTFKPLYGTSNQAITITSAATLGNGSAASSAAVDNTTNLFLDAEVTVKVTTAASGVSSTGTVTVYAYGTTDGGATYGGGEANMGTDHAVTLTSPPNITQLMLINANAASASYQVSARSVAAALGLSTLPDHWGIVVVNNTGAALTACTANYQGMQIQSV